MKKISNKRTLNLMNAVGSLIDVDNIMNNKRLGFNLFFTGSFDYIKLEDLLLNKGEITNRWIFNEMLIHQMYKIISMISILNNDFYKHLSKNALIIDFMKIRSVLVHPNDVFKEGRKDAYDSNYTFMYDSNMKWKKMKNTTFFVDSYFSEGEEVFKTLKDCEKIDKDYYQSMSSFGYQNTKKEIKKLIDEITSEAKKWVSSKKSEGGNMSNLKRGPKPIADSTGSYDQRYRDRKGNGSDNSKVRPAK